MARLYVNENFPLPVVAELRRLGYDLLTSCAVRFSTLHSLYGAEHMGLVPPSQADPVAP